MAYLRVFALRLLLSMLVAAIAYSSAGAVNPIPANPPIPPLSDSWLSFIPPATFVLGVGITTAQEAGGMGFFLNTGIATTSPTGNYIELLEGCCGDSDFVVANAGFLYFSSDDNNGNLIPPKDIVPPNTKLTNVGILTETGGWQEITNRFTWPVAGTQVWVASDPPEPAPEPATWVMMLIGFVLVGVFPALRRYHRSWNRVLGEK